jgi:hypothetical protein
MAQQFLHCCMGIHWCREVFITPLPSIGHRLWLHWSGLTDIPPPPFYGTLESIVTEFTILIIFWWTLWYMQNFFEDLLVYYF